MNALVKNIGVILLLFGAFLMAATYIAGAVTNTILIVGLLTVFAGYILHIILNKKVE
ncbi:MAG: hypothetical protein LBU08_01095 [Tannerellaceae bacterium]|jgi:uncharacterized membrane protein|nr:hypothetical protein [Tannerellaceae bacterium]